MKRIATVIALVALALPAVPQERTFGENIDVNAVLLDVIVTDAKGNQILGLTKDDFIVKENGVAQEVESVDYLTNRTLVDTREENAPFQVEKTNEPRYFIFFFDKPQEVGVLFDQVTRAREAARDFVKNEMKPNDYVAVVGHDMRLKVYSDFTTDKKALDAALNDATKFGNGLLPDRAPADGPSILRSVGRAMLVNKTGTVYEALDVLGDSVRSIRARKNLVLFSPGIADINETIRNGTILDRSQYFDPALQSLNAANVSVYAVQLQQPIDPAVSTTPAIHQRLNELADSTGGRYFQFNTNFKPAVKSVEKANAGYYLVSYRAKKARGEKGFQKVDVQVKNPEFRVNARSGYEFGS